MTLPIEENSDWAQLKALGEAPPPVNTEEAVANERSRCAALVQAEIDAGRAVGLPDSSAAMRIVYRILGAIQNG
jgi:hypothetical protein